MKTTHHSHAHRTGKLRATAELLDHTMRAIYSQCFVDGLNPAQWSALRYLERANPSSRTLTEFARSHFVSKSAASDTISALVRKKLVEKTRDPQDGRVMRLELTDRGRKRLNTDPLDLLVSALASLSAQDQAVAADLAAMVARDVFTAVTAEPATQSSQIVPTAVEAK